jgi:group I intron endonuclease
MKISGIYEIRNKINGKVYIGSSKNIRQRWIDHKTELRQQIHNNQHLQFAVDKYGLENFEFKIIETTHSTKEERLTREQHYMDLYQSYDDRFGYNLTRKADCTEFTDEVKKKISLSKIGKPRPQSVKDALSKAHLGKPSWSKGKSFSQEHKKKMSLSHIGKHWHTAETKQFLKQLSTGNKYGIGNKNHLGHFKSKIELICLFCKKEFSKRPSEATNFCSILCSLKSRKKSRIVLNCKNCDKKFERLPCRVSQYCSQKCYYTRYKEFSNV